MTQRQPSTLQRLITLTAEHRPQATLILPGSDSDAISAQITSWDLLASGLAHLDSGGMHGKFGSLTTAVSRASLRSAPLAAGLNIPAPVFKSTTVVSLVDDAHTQALFWAKRMVEAVTNDIDASVPVITRALQADKMIDADTRQYFNLLADTHRRQCDTLMQLISHVPPPPRISPDKGFSF